MKDIPYKAWCSLRDFIKRMWDCLKSVKSSECSGSVRDRIIKRNNTFSTECSSQLPQCFSSLLAKLPKVVASRMCVYKYCWPSLTPGWLQSPSCLEISCAASNRAARHPRRQEAEAQIKRKLASAVVLAVINWFQSPSGNPSIIRGDRRPRPELNMGSVHLLQTLCVCPGGTGSLSKWSQPGNIIRPLLCGSSSALERWAEFLHWEKLHL